MDTAVLMYMELRPKEVILFMLKNATNLISVAFLILQQVLKADVLHLGQ